MADAKRDNNVVTTMLAVSNADGVTPVVLWADPITHRLLVTGVGAGSGTVTTVSVVTANGISGSVATATSTPAITLTLGSITPSAIQITGLTVSQILALDGSGNVQSLAVATYPSLTELSYVKGVTSSIQTQINAKGVGTVTAVSVATANGFSGSSSGGATPSLTIVAGVITPTSVNGLTITTTTGTLTVTGSKVLTISNTLTLAGTDSTTMTFPSTSATIGRTDAAQTFTGTQTFSQIVETVNTVSVTSNAGTVPITSRNSNFTNSSASAMTITMTTTSAQDGMKIVVRIYDFSGVAQTITWVNTENSTALAPTTSNGSTTSCLTVGFQYNSATSKWRCIAVS